MFALEQTNEIKWNSKRNTTEIPSRISFWGYTSNFFRDDFTGKYYMFEPEIRAGVLLT